MNVVLTESARCQVACWDLAIQADDTARLIDQVPFDADWRTVDYARHEVLFAIERLEMARQQIHALIPPSQEAP